MTEFSDDELRMLSVSGPVLLRMLRTREELILKKIYGDYRNGTLDQTARIAEFACVRDQIREIITALKLRDQGE